MPNVIETDADTAFNHYTYNKPPVIGFMGRLSPEKGVDCLLKALAILKRKKINFEVIIAGEGRCKRKLMNQTKSLNLENDVKFIGWINNKEDFFEKIDIFGTDSTKLGQVSIARNLSPGVALSCQMLKQNPMLDKTVLCFLVYIHT